MANSGSQGQHLASAGTARVTEAVSDQENRGQLYRHLAKGPSNKPPIAPASDSTGKGAMPTRRPVPVLTMLTLPKASVH